MKHCFLVCAALVAVAAGADSLADLRQALGRYPAKAAFAASAVVQLNASTQNDASRGGTAAFDIEWSAKGFSVLVSPATLDAAQREAAAKKRDPNAATPTRTAMVALNVFDILGAMDAAAMLLDDLSGATPIGESSVTLDGKPAKLLRVKVKPSFATQSRFVAAPEIELKIWIGGDGVPVAAERVSIFSAGIGPAKGSNVRTERWTLATYGDRLYASRNDEDDRASAVGRQMSSSRAVLYTPKDHGH